jgi:chorismate synthase
MPGNTFGQLFRITTFGESHGPGIGVVIDGCPPGININLHFIQVELDRRRPGQSTLVTQRREKDKINVLSGVIDGQSTGAPLTLWIENTDARSKDYTHIEESYRPSHADYTYQKKYGIRDVRGGGRSSARETAARVAAGAIAKIILSLQNITIRAYVSQVGPIRLYKEYHDLDLDIAESNPVRCPDPEVANEMIAFIKAVRKEGDTTGGAVECVIRGCPPGLGEPVFDKLHADLGKAMLSINACKGFEYGSGFGGILMKGSEHNDIFETENEVVKTRTNFSGGIQGGISNGMDIYFKCAFKPVSTLMKSQQSINQDGDDVVLEGRGRHDPCVVPRAVPIIESMAALVLVDHLMRNRSIQTVS